MNLEPLHHLHWTRSRRPGRATLAVAVVVILCLARTAIADERELEPPRPPGPKERCAVCGMYVARHPTWAAALVQEHGPTLYFDGPKDLFRFLLDTKRYRHDPIEIESVWVTDYYTTRLVPARDVLYVLGSDVMGPMGAELVPVAGTEAAAAFAADHGATRTLRYDEISLEDIPE